jgi:hypothetical protein
VVLVGKLWEVPITGQVASLDSTSISRRRDTEASINLIETSNGA